MILSCKEGKQLVGTWI